MTAAPGDTLHADDFPDFYRAVHGFAPFPWQHDLCSRALAEGRWPDLVDVPTGLGKTSMLDVAVFVAAATAHLPGPHRLGRRRCFFVVDRRIVVDEAYDHAQKLACALRGDATGVLGRVAAGLRAYAPDAAGELLPVTRMRGGSTWDDAWLDRPDRAGIVLGTVDQVGSRLLFRGYGVSDRRRPLDAALVGTDSLVLVDEAHLATALLTTVHAARQRDRLGLPLPGLTLVQLSATGRDTDHPYRLDLDAHRGDPEAWPRLTAAKRLLLHTATAKTCAREMTRITIEQLVALTGADTGAPVGLVVCNTVNLARSVHTQLVKALPDADIELLIGRSRPLDRPELQSLILDRFGTDRPVRPRTAVLVATQTVEVGVNLDVDVLITEAASWDALVQRLGRLNRLGRFTGRFPGRDAAVAVAVYDGQVDGPVYGTARDATWTALGALAAASADAGIGVSPVECRNLSSTELHEPELSRQPQGTPVLLQPTLDAWAQTSPVPLNDPPVAPFLHGFASGTAAVQVVWRDGLLHREDGAFVEPLDDDDPEEVGGERASRQIDALLTQWPPRTGEIAEIPFLPVRAWLAGLTPGPVDDLDGTADIDTRVLRLRGSFAALAQRPSRRATDAPLTWQWIESDQIRPGDRIVVPTERGGLDRYGWAPADDKPVTDVSEAAAFTASRSRRHAVLRIDTTLAERLGTGSDTASPLLALRHADAPEPETISAAARHFAAYLPDTPPERSGWSLDGWSALLAWFTGTPLRILAVHDPDEARIPGEQPEPWAYLLVGPIPSVVVDHDTPAATEGDDEEVAMSSVGTGRVTLHDHHDAVRHRAAAIATALGLPPELHMVITDAARWHDLGKNDTRFQVMLHGGDTAEAALADEPLAKSGLDPADRQAWRRAARLSGLPAGARHEAWSAALIEDHMTTRLDYPHADLLIHLVASHHGYARPLARLVLDTDPQPVEAVIDGDEHAVSSARTVSLDQPGRFARLNDRYGRWGLALLETVVRSADTTVSGEGS